MSGPTELHARLLADARSYDPAVHHRGLLGPYRDVLVLWRAKFMSYEQIAAALTRHGIKVSAAGVGAYCRRAITKVEIERMRQEHLSGKTPISPTPKIASPQPPGVAQRGPKIARDDY
ncbi:hypothetical protein [Oleiharenicola lentus]|uniref:hypothetical protein n=1 Tax=Oleiharenicola lentus TaxID=2508720 RepID=UPI003F66EB04